MKVLLLFLTHEETEDSRGSPSSMADKIGTALQTGKGEATGREPSFSSGAISIACNGCGTGARKVHSLACIKTPSP